MPRASLRAHDQVPAAPPPPRAEWLDAHAPERHVILETVLRVIFTTGGKAGAAELRAHQQWEHMTAHAEGSIGAPKARGEGGGGI